VGDQQGAQILDMILNDEVGHVSTGDRWYRPLCAQRGIDPVQTHTELAQRHGVARGWFHWP